MIPYLNSRPNDLILRRDLLRMSGDYMLFGHSIREWIALFPWTFKDISDTRNYVPKPFEVTTWQGASLRNRFIHEVAHVLSAAPEDLSKDGWGLGPIPWSLDELSDEALTHETSVMILHLRMTGQRSDRLYDIRHSLIYWLSQTRTEREKVVREAYATSPYRKMSSKRLWAKAQKYARSV